jgi:hypothetical protein
LPEPVEGSYSLVKRPLADEIVGVYSCNSEVHFTHHGPNHPEYDELTALIFINNIL